MSDSEFYHKALVRRLRNRDDCDDDIRGACDEIEDCCKANEKLEAEVERLRSKLRLQDAVIRSGAVLLLTDEEREAINVAQNVLAGTQTAKTLARVLERTENIAHTLTDEEREAVNQAIDAASGMASAEPWAINALRKLLERLK